VPVPPVMANKYGAGLFKMTKACAVICPPPVVGLARDRLRTWTHRARAFYRRGSR
jgi:hypothetical protein